MLKFREQKSYSINSNPKDYTQENYKYITTKVYEMIEAT